MGAARTDLRIRQVPRQFQGGSPASSPKERRLVSASRASHRRPHAPQPFDGSPIDCWLSCNASADAPIGDNPELVKTSDCAAVEPTIVAFTLPSVGQGEQVKLKMAICWALTNTSNLSGGAPLSSNWPTPANSTYTQSCWDGGFARALY
jgi:hypothetical protein